MSQSDAPSAEALDMFELPILIAEWGGFGGEKLKERGVCVPAAGRCAREQKNKKELSIFSPPRGTWRT